MASAHAWKRLTDAKFWLVAALKADTSLPLAMSEDRSNHLRGNRLPRRVILRGKDSFDVIFKNGVRIAGKLIDIRYYVPPTPENGVRTAFVAGKKIGNAVRRNRNKRLLREAYRLQQHILEPVLPTITGLNMVIIVKTQGITFQSVFDEMGFLLNKLANNLSTNRDIA